MPPGRPALPSVDEPITDLTDQRVVQILSTEHWSLLTSRSLAYNEAFTRGGMFLTFLSASFVALALFSTAMSFGDDFLIVAAIVLAFDFIIGVLTYGRILGANVDDLRAVHGMSRIRHAYTQIAPITTPYSRSGRTTTSRASCSPTERRQRAASGDLVYGLTTSGGMIGLITCMVGGVFVAVAALLIGASGGWAVAAGIIGTAVILAVTMAVTVGAVPRQQAALEVLFPTPAPEKPTTDR